jgi:DNA-directed RNA polymerase subunit M/transcription elongation factor TFIIS
VEAGLNMVYLKECPKCQGDLMSGEDADGRYLSCIQCGYLRELPAENAPVKAWETFVIDAPQTAKKRRKKDHQAA